MTVISERVKMNSPIHCSLHRSITIRCKEAWEAESGWDKKEDLWYEKRDYQQNTPHFQRKHAGQQRSLFQIQDMRPAGLQMSPCDPQQRRSVQTLWLNHPRINRKESPRVWRCYAKYFLSVRNRAENGAQTIP